MNKIMKRNSKGQILVIVTLMLVGLFAMLALVLDGGNLYTQRRAAQLAADAGALAGARARCDPDVIESPEVAANIYVTKNDATLKKFSLGPGEMEVTVETSITFDTFFLGILGRPELTAEAIAAAKCETGSGASVLPVAWSCRPPDFSVGDSGDFPGVGCDLAIDNKNSTCTYPSDPDISLENPVDKFYIVIDSTALEEVIYCAENDYNYPYGPLDDPWADGFTCADCKDVEIGDPRYAYCHSDYPKCDLDCDGVSDIEILTQSSYGWIDLDGGSSNANELSQWVLGENNPKVKIHHWYSDKSGIATNVFQTVGGLEDKRVVVPVFDHFCNGKEYGPPGPDNPDCTWHPDPPDELKQDTVVLSSKVDDYFHIIGFANYLVTCVEAGPYGPCEINKYLVDQGVMKKNTKSIEGCFIQGVSSEIEDVGGGLDFDAYTLVLSR